MAGFAHRGRHGPGVPENNLAAFRAAIADGAGIECDLRLSCYGFALIFHDSSLERMCGIPAETEATKAAALLACHLQTLTSVFRGWARYSIWRVR
jgi:glycerophosphoryl diester phosphodiesterase